MFPFTTNCQKNQIIYLRHSLFPYKAALSYFLPDFAMYDGFSCFVFQYSDILHDSSRVICSEKKRLDRREEKMYLLTVLLNWKNHLWKNLIKIGEKVENNYFLYWINMYDIYIFIYIG